eukprot:COSAG02_NODE_201_length_29473_cov_135.510213_20_plen_174_part_00
MECQYAFQKKKAIVPLKLTEGYEADGWLGLLLGTSLWYALYGSTLSSESAFESRVDSVARELGGRGKRDAAVGVAARQGQADDDGCFREPEPEPEPEPSGEEDAVDSFESELRAELESVWVKALEQRALADGVDADAIEDALDEDNSKAALIELIVAAAVNRRKTLPPDDQRS